MVFPMAKELLISGMVLITQVILLEEMQAEEVFLFLGVDHIMMDNLKIPNLMAEESCII